MRTEDACIVQECLNGESEAFGILVDKYKAGIYAYVYAKLGNFHDSEDIVQEVFLQAYRNLRNLRRWESFSFWLYRIARNLCGNSIRASSKRPDRDFIEDQDAKVLGAFSINSYRESRMDESLREGLSLLSEGYREVLMLHYFGGMKSADIARSLGISPTAVRKRLSRARAQLREEMTAMMGTAFEGQRLPATFTFRIVEAVKRININPTPRMAGVPWGLSLAMGIIITVLSINPQMSIPRDMSIPTGSPLLVERRELKTEEIPVDILRVARISVISSKQEDGSIEDTQLPNPQNALLMAPNDEEAADVKLSARDGVDKGYFGIAVDISGDYAIVAAPWDDDKGEDTGSVYFFKREGDSWSEAAKFTPHGQPIDHCNFGNSIDISGDYIIVGSRFEDWASGAAYIFHYDGNSWEEEAKFTAKDNARQDNFGYSVSISGDFAIVGAIGDKNKGDWTGSAYFFKREGTSWVEHAKVTANDVGADAAFGLSVYISGGYAIVGAPWTDDNGLDSGSAYIFYYDGVSWGEQVKVTASDGAANDRFGKSVYISDDYAIVSANRDDNKGLSDSGSIHVFLRNGTSWNQVSKHIPSDGEAGDRFGTSVSIAGDYAIVGAYMDDDKGLDSGSAYIYHARDLSLPGKAVEPQGKLPTMWGGVKRTELYQNYPNPFNPETWIPFDLSEPKHVTIRIYRSTGQLVRTLDLGQKPSGTYVSKDKAAYWNGRNEAGEEVASDVYFCTMQAGEFTSLKKIVMTR